MGWRERESQLTRGIEERIAALRRIAREEGRKPNEDEIATVVGLPSPVRRSAIPVWVPKRIDEIENAARRVADPLGRVQYSAIMDQVGCSLGMVTSAARILKDQDRWPYQRFRRSALMIAKGKLQERK